MQLIKKYEREELLDNGRKSAATPVGERFDPKPVVKLFTPDGACTWLLSELDPEEPDIAFGLCDLGVGCPELGSVRLSELQSIRGSLGLPVERDLFFVAEKPLSAYTDAAINSGRVMA